MKIFVALLICLTFSAGALSAQEHKHEEPKEKSAPAKKDPSSAKTQSMNCCESMEQMGEMKLGLPMKSDMKAKMDTMKELKEKLAEKIGEKGTELKIPEPKAEKSQSSSDEHQH